MTRETSTYLDLVRFLAALTVFLGHLSGQRTTGGFLWQFEPLMNPAVDIFFVLSGFVIGHIVQDRENNVGNYIVARAARVYSVALPALLLTFILDSAGRAIRPDLYSLDWGYIADGRAWQFFSGTLFMNQIWFVNVRPGSMLPYWSLCFEVWYYIIFGLAIFSPARWRMAAVVVAIAVVGPRIAIMFPLWLLGVLCLRILAKVPSHHDGSRNILGWSIFAGSIGTTAGFGMWFAAHQWPGHVPEFLGRPTLLEDYVVAILFAANLIGFSLISKSFAPLLTLVAGPVRWFAGATFTLYLLHMPISQFLSTLVPWPPQAIATRIVIVGFTLIAVLLIAEVTERRKAAWRSVLTVLIRSKAPAI